MSRTMRAADRDALLTRLPALWADPDVSVAAIGERFGISPASVRVNARKLGLGPKPRLRMQRQRRVPLNRRAWVERP